jgi:hypothetical protein
MNGSETATINGSPTGRACLVDGCTCKDARIVSTRRTAYFASVASLRGETANRMIAADPMWSLPASPADEFLEGAA